MDIWEWVFKIQEDLLNSGQMRLAELIDLVPRYTVDCRHEELDAALPEALGLARAAGIPWLEVFFRHWNLQSRVLQRMEVRDSLGEAVSLLEFATRDETKNCPQSKCVVQDLACCYANLDGPGYAEERLAVAGETLAGLDATWPCFLCIGGEYADALRDSDRNEESLDFINGQFRQLLEAGLYDKRYNLRGGMVASLVALGRYEEAYRFNKEARNMGGGESYMIGKAIDASRLASLLGRHAEAKKSLPGFERVKATPSRYGNWTRAVVLLVQSGQVTNDQGMHFKLMYMFERLKANGAVRSAVTQALRAAELALLRESPDVAGVLADEIEALIPELRKPLDAPEKLAALRAQIAGAGRGRARDPESRA